VLLREVGWRRRGGAKGSEDGQEDGAHRVRGSVEVPASPTIATTMVSARVLLRLSRLACAHVGSCTRLSRGSD
jgi:hypothetical protein